MNPLDFKRCKHQQTQRILVGWVPTTTCLATWKLVFHAKNFRPHHLVVDICMLDRLVVCCECIWRRGDVWIVFVVVIFIVISPLTITNKTNAKTHEESSCDDSNHSTGAQARISSSLFLDFTAITSRFIPGSFCGRIRVNDFTPVDGRNTSDIDQRTTASNAIEENCHILVAFVRGSKGERRNLRMCKVGIRQSIREFLVESQCNGFFFPSIFCILQSSSVAEARAVSECQSCRIVDHPGVLAIGIIRF